MMKKLGILLALTIFSVAKLATATDPDCIKVATAPLESANKCKELGYTKTADFCWNPNLRLRCPFNNGLYFCNMPEGGENTKECEVGDILFDDFKCYARRPLSPDTKPMAVVFDAENKLAVALTNAGDYAYMTPFDKLDKVATTSGMTGCNSTCDTYIGMDAHSHTSCPYQGCKISSSDAKPIKDAPCNDTPESTFRGNQYRTTPSSKLGWIETSALRNLQELYKTKTADGANNIETPAAVQCYKKTNATSDEIINGGASSNSFHAKFLPAVGDLIKLHDNVTQVRKGFTLAQNAYGVSVNDFEDGQWFRSSTQAYLAKTQSDNGAKTWCEKSSWTGKYYKCTGTNPNDSDYTLITCSDLMSNNCGLWNDAAISGSTSLKCSSTLSGENYKENYVDSWSVKVVASGWTAGGTTETYIGDHSSEQVKTVRCIYYYGLWEDAAPTQGMIH